MMRQLADPAADPIEILLTPHLEVQGSVALHRE